MKDVESSVEFIFGTYKSIGDVLRMIKLQKHKITYIFVPNNIIPWQQSFKEGGLTRGILGKKTFPQAISLGLFGVEQKTWYLGISTARDLFKNHVLRFKKYV